MEADLILMDIEMPGINGLDAARAVLEQRPECKVIFVTAYSLFQYAHEAMHLGACDYLLKPVDPDEAEAAIRRAIRQIEAGRKLAELAPVAPEPAADTAEAEDRNALVMAHVRRYMEDNYMFDLSLDSVSEDPAYQPGIPFGTVQKVSEDEFSGLPDRAAHQCGKAAADRPAAFCGGGRFHGRVRGRQLFCPCVQKAYRYDPHPVPAGAPSSPGGSSVSARRIAALTLAAVLCLLMLAGCVVRPKEQAQTQPELLLRYAENQPADYPTTQAALAFAEMVSQRTDGRVKILVYSDGELGSEPSVVQQMQFGGIDFSRVSLSELANILPGLSILQLPYLYEDAAQMWRVLDGPIGNEFLLALDAVGLVGLPGLMQACAAFIPGRRSPAWRICRGWLCGCSSLA